MFLQQSTERLNQLVRPQSANHIGKPWIQTIQQRRVEHEWCLKLSQSYHIFHFSYWSRNSIWTRWDNYFMIWVIQVMNKSLLSLPWTILLKLQFVFYNLNVVIGFDWWCKYDNKPTQIKFLRTNTFSHHYCNRRPIAAWKSVSLTTSLKLRLG